MEVCRAVIALDDRERATRLQHPPKPRERARRVGQMLEHEADEDMVEGRLGERQVENVGVLELDVVQASQIHRPSRSGERRRGDVDRDERGAWTPSRERHGLRADAAAGLEHAAALGIFRVAVQEVDQRAGLILEALALAPMVSVNVARRMRCASQLPASRGGRRRERVLNVVADAESGYARRVRMAAAQAPGVNPKWPTKARVM